MLLVGAIEACAAYQGIRAGLAFRAARTPRDLDGANLRALSAIAFASLGAGEALRYVGIALFAVLVLAFVRYARKRSTAAVTASTVPSMIA
jgi:hypothetical protein